MSWRVYKQEPGTLGSEKYERVGGMKRRGDKERKSKRRQEKGMQGKTMIGKRKINASNTHEKKQVYGLLRYFKELDTFHLASFYIFLSNLDSHT
jgi:hypothetical protein